MTAQPGVSRTSSRMLAPRPTGSHDRRKQDHQYAGPGSDAASLVPETWRFAVVLPIISESASNFEQIEDISSTIIRKIVKEKNEDGYLTYQTIYEDGSQEWVYLSCSERDLIRQ